MGDSAPNKSALRPRVLGRNQAARGAAYQGRREKCGGVWRLCCVVAQVCLRVCICGFACGGAANHVPGGQVCWTWIVGVVDE
jgi:hypothetical protein